MVDLQLGPENFGFTDPLTGTWNLKNILVVLMHQQVVWKTVWSSYANGSTGGTAPSKHSMEVLQIAQIF